MYISQRWQLCDNRNLFLSFHKLLEEQPNKQICLYLYIDINIDIDIGIYGIRYIWYNVGIGCSCLTGQSS